MNIWGEPAIFYADTDDENYQAVVDEGCHELRTEKWEDGRTISVRCAQIPSPEICRICKERAICGRSAAERE
jgi:hypothetical protein